MPADIAIEVRGLAKRFGEVQAVAGIDVDVRQGEVLGFLGPNGAGKTTTINMESEVFEGRRRDGAPTPGGVRASKDGHKGADR